MGRGKETEKAQNISEQQIALSREQMQQQNELLKQELTRRNQLLDPLYQSLLPAIQSRVSGGMSPEAQAALKGQAIESVPSRFEDAQRNLTTMLAQRGLFGGDTPAAGVTAPYFSSLATGMETTRAGLLRDAILQNEQAKEAAIGQGGGLAGAITGSYSPSPFIYGAGNALGAAGQATGVRAQLIKPGFWDYAAPVIGAALGAGGQYFAGGYGRARSQPTQDQPF